MTANAMIEKRLADLARRQAKCRERLIDAAAVCAGAMACLYYNPDGLFATAGIGAGGAAAAYVLARTLLTTTASDKAEVPEAIVAGLLWGITWRTFIVYLVFAVPADLLLGWLELRPSAFAGQNVFALRIENALIGVVALVISAQLALKESYLGFRFTVTRAHPNARKQAPLL